MYLSHLITFCLRAVRDEAWRKLSPFQAKVKTTHKSRTLGKCNVSLK
jgi:hypothetical protein